MVQTKAKEQTGRKVIRRRPTPLPELPMSVVLSGTRSVDVEATEQEERMKRIQAVHGQFADINYSSEDYDRDKQREIEREDRQL